MEGNFAHYVDRLALGRHNYAPTRDWDPEGIISTLPAIATALFGVMAGHILRLRRELAERTTWLYLAGTLLLAAGLVADHWMPINKKLWTSSFALFMAGLDFLILATSVWLVDGLGWRRPARPFVVLGMNAIAIYMASEIIEGSLIAFGAKGAVYRAVFAPLPLSPYNTSLLYALALTALMFVLAYAMRRKGWYWRV